MVNQAYSYRVQQYKSPYRKDAVRPKDHRLKRIEPVYSKQFDQASKVIGEDDFFVFKQAQVDLEPFIQNKKSGNKGRNILRKKYDRKEYQPSYSPDITMERRNVQKAISHKKHDTRTEKHTVDVYKSSRDHPADLLKKNKEKQRLLIEALRSNQNQKTYRQLSKSFDDSHQNPTLIPATQQSENMEKFLGKEMPLKEGKDLPTRNFEIDTRIS